MKLNKKFLLAPAVLAAFGVAVATAPVSADAAEGTTTTVKVQTNWKTELVNQIKALVPEANRQSAIDTVNSMNYADASNYIVTLNSRFGIGITLPAEFTETTQETPYWKTDLLDQIARLLPADQVESAQSYISGVGYGDAQLYVTNYNYPADIANKLHILGEDVKAPNAASDNNRYGDSDTSVKSGEDVTNNETAKENNTRFGGAVVSTPDFSTVLRAYNPNSGAHLFTISQKEMNEAVAAGWEQEDAATWVAPAQGNTVYRAYNENSGEHFFTMDKGELADLVAVGWTDEGTTFNSDAKKGVPVYRLFNPNAKEADGTAAGSHHYTTSIVEAKEMVQNGWTDEGVALYGAVAE